MTRVNAPWSQGQVKAINRYQLDPKHHPFTCPQHSNVALHAGSSELYCPSPNCDYIQQWVHHFMCELTL